MGVKLNTKKLPRAWLVADNKVKIRLMETVRIIFFVAYSIVILLGLYKHVRRNKHHTDDEQHVDKETLEAINRKGKEELEFTLESVNAWLNNCDQKAGMVLAVIGVAVTVLMTGDFVKFLRDYIFTPFVEYCEGQGEYLFSLSRFIVFFLLVVAASLLIMSCYYLFKAIGANINYTKMYNENPGLVQKSYIFFGSISGMKYDEFKKDEVNYEDDLKSQIYVNSKIAATKFHNYNEGLYWFKFLLLVIGMLFVAVMIMK